jgi:hypothetical protein
MTSWESPFTRSCRTPSDSVVLSPNMRASYSAMLLVALNWRWTMYLNYSLVRVRSKTPTPAPCFHEEPSKKRVQCGPVKTRALSSGSVSSRPPGWHGGGVQSVTKSASTWLFTAWHGTKSSLNSTHLAMLPVASGLWSTTLSEYEDTTEIF